MSAIYSTRKEQISVTGVTQFTDRRVLIICQGNLRFFIDALHEVKSDYTFAVTCREEEVSGLDSLLKTVKYVNEYFNSSEVDTACYSILRENKIERIIATSETDILRAAKLRDLFRIPGQTFESALFFRDKILMKERLLTHGIQVPLFKRVNSPLDVFEFIEAHSYPCIIKPARGYGSVKTTVLHNSGDLECFFKTTSCFNEFLETNLDIEKYIPADMYHIDGIIRDGKIIAIWPSKCINTCLAMTTGSPTGSYLLSTQNPLVPTLIRFAEKVLTALPTPVDTGFHLELFWDEKECTFCEIASRIGGPWINDLWVHGMGFDLKNEFVRAQASLPTRYSSPVTQKSLVGGMIFPRQRGIVQAIPSFCDLDGVIEYTSFIHPGDRLNTSNGMLDHILAFTFTAPSEEAIERKIEDIHQWVQEKVRILPA